MTHHTQKSSRKKILVIGYGGTIVMVVDPVKKAIVPAKDMKEILALLPRLDEFAEVSMDFLCNKDSTNITPDDWSRLALYIYEIGGCDPL